MADCPFCQAAISEEMSLYGGHCPSCLIQIPGEEAATDPGVGKTAEVAGSSGWGTVMSGAVAAVAVFAAIGGWYFYQQPGNAPSASMEDVAHIPLSMHEDQPFEAEVAAADEIVAPTEPSHVAPRPRTTRAQLPGNGEPVAEGSVIPKAGSDLTGSPLDAFATVGVSPTNRGPQGIVLQDPGQIEVMIRRVLDRGAKRLESCYNQQLKMNPGFSGSWDVSLRVTRDGTAEAVRARALRGSDATTATCIQREAARWTFQRVVEPYEISRTYRFGG
jgi:hypothetical protein